MVCVKFMSMSFYLPTVLAACRIVINCENPLEIFPFRYRYFQPGQPTFRRGLPAKITALSLRVRICICPSVWPDRASQFQHGGIAARLAKLIRRNVCLVVIVLSPTLDGAGRRFLRIYAYNGCRFDQGISFSARRVLDHAPEVVLNGQTMRR